MKVDGSAMHEEAMEDKKGGIEDIIQRFFAWLKSRTTDHWLMFAIGLAVGLIL